MKNSSSKVKIAFVLLSLSFMASPYASGGYPREIEISTPKNTIRIGEPLIVKVTYKFEEPQLSKSKLVYRTMPPDASVSIKRGDMEIVVQGYPLSPGVLYLRGKQELEYSGTFLLFYDIAKKKLIFDEPGIYTISIRRTRVHISNPLEITVEPASESVKQALSLLSDPNDYFLLVYGEDGGVTKATSHLSQVVERHKDTLLAKWAAAQVGLQYWEDFHKNNPISEKFIAEQQGQVNEPLLDQAHSYLTLGAKLPDEFPVRENVLARLSSTEFIKGNYEKAFSLLDELEAKYPYGEYGKQATREKQQMQKLIKKLELK